MSEFFRGWRRKVGCVTLILAVAATTSWMRSMILADTLMFGVGNEQYMVFSSDGMLSWYSWRFATSDRPSVGTQFVAKSIRLSDPSFFVATSYQRACHLSRRWTIPYRVFAISLTLLSAYLILWKPCPKPEEQPHA